VACPRDRERDELVVAAVVDVEVDVGEDRVREVEDATLLCLSLAISRMTTARVTGPPRPSQPPRPDTAFGDANLEFAAS
jgi:hypothetical protein